MFWPSARHGLALLGAFCGVGVLCAQTCVRIAPEFELAGAAAATCSAPSFFATGYVLAPMIGLLVILCAAKRESI